MHADGLHCKGYIDGNMRLGKQTSTLSIVSSHQSSSRRAQVCLFCRIYTSIRYQPNSCKLANSGLLSSCLLCSCPAWELMRRECFQAWKRATLLAMSGWALWKVHLSGAGAAIARKRLAKLTMAGTAHRMSLNHSYSKGNWQ